MMSPKLITLCKLDAQNRPTFETVDGGRVKSAAAPEFDYLPSALN